MLDTLRLVRGVVSEREGIASVLQHFHIENGTIYGSNGRLTLEAPFPDLFGGASITVPADPFLKAVDACQGEPEMELVDEGTLVVHRNRFKAKLPLSQDPFLVPAEIGEAEIFEVNETGYLDAIRRIRTFVSKDATRPWALGVLHADGYLYATNNIILVRTPAERFPTLNVPSFALDEVLRIGRQPDQLWMNDSTVAFDFGEGVWLRSILYADRWPDVAAMFSDCGSQVAISEETREVVAKLVPFCVDSKFPVITFTDSSVKTLDGEMQAEFEGVLNCTGAAFHATPLSEMLRVAVSWDLAPYPKPCPWQGEKLEGLIVGVNT